MYKRQVDNIYFGSNSGFIYFGDIVATSLSTTLINTNVIYASSVQALQISGATTTLNLVSTTAGLQYSYQTAGFLSTTTLQSTVTGLASSGYVSTTSLVSTVAGITYSYQTAGFVSAPNLLGHVSTSTLNLSLTSTVAGLQYTYQTAGFLSTATLTSTVQGLGLTYVSTSSLTASLVSTVAGIQYNYQTSGFLSTQTLQSTVAGLGQIYVSTSTLTATLTSTTQGLQYSYQTAGFLSTQTLQSTVAGLGQVYVSTSTLTASLVSTTAGIQYSYQTAGFISTQTLQSTVAGLGQIYVSTVAAAVNQSNITSTVVGLGTVGYVSSAQLLSTGASYANYFTTLSASFSSVTASNVFASTLIVNNLQIGTGLGWVNIGPLQTVALSTTQVQAGTVYATSNLVGSVSTPFNAIQFYGLFGQYNNTVLAEVSTGVGTQELLLFKGSSISDRIRLQTTGSIVFEPGSSARLWPSSITSNAVPAMVIDTNSNVGIKTGTSVGIALDVAGLGRFQQLSTLNIQVSTINGQSFGAPINSTVIGLGSALSLIHI